MDSTTKARRLRDHAKTLSDTAACYGKLLRLRFNVGRLGRLPQCKNSKSLLLLCWTFPPEVSSGVFRPAAMASFASRAGWETTVLCGPPPDNPSPAGLKLLTAIPDEVRVDRIESILCPTYRFFPKIHGGYNRVFAMVDRAVRQFRERPPAIVLATGPYFQSFVAGYELARRFRAKLVLDYRDEWTLCPFDSIAERHAADLAWEPRCLRAADLVVFTTQSQLENCLRTFPGLDPSKVTVVPNGWEPADFDPSRATDRAGETTPGRLSLDFVGMLLEHRHPGGFLNSLAEVLSRRADLASRLKVHFAGGKSREALAQIAEFPFQQCIRLTDYVPKREANRIMVESSALLVFNGPRMARYLPGKIYEYLAAGPPLLVDGKGGEIEDLVSKLGAGLVVPSGDSGAMEAAIDEIDAAPQSRWHSPGRERWLSEHTRERLSMRLLDALQALVSE